MSRVVTLALVDPTGTPLGTLPPFAVSRPHWQEVDEIVDGARDRFGLDVTVLRLLDADQPMPPGGAVTYLAECAPAPVPEDLGPPRPDLAPHPLRARWAEPGGPAASLRWATDALAGLGRSPVTATQHRTWNLSAIWRLDGPWGRAWLKQVPPFFVHEAAVLRWVGTVAPDRVPTVLAAAEDRLLLADAPGWDRYDAGPAEMRALIGDLHEVQLASLGGLDALVGRGVPDLRGPRLTDSVLATASAHLATVPGLDRLLDDLPRRMAAVDACGLPDTLVHGDFHPGNSRSDGTVRRLIDWGDAFIGHPAFDALRMTGWAAPADAPALLTDWADAWRAAVAGCAPEEAARLLAPVVHLRAAAVYAGFLAHIEPSEWPYHAADVADALRRAVEVAA